MAICSPLDGDLVSVINGVADEVLCPLVFIRHFDRRREQDRKQKARDSDPNTPNRVDASSQRGDAGGEGHYKQKHCDLIEAWHVALQLPPLSGCVLKI